MAEVVKGHRNELEKALSLDMNWLANEMNSLDRCLMTDQEHEGITSPSSRLSPSEKAGVIVSALLRRVELDSKDLDMFVGILNQKPQQYKAAIGLLRGYGRMEEPPRKDRRQIKKTTAIEDKEFDIEKVDANELRLADAEDVQYAVRNLHAHWKTLSINIHLSRRTVKRISEKCHYDDSKCLNDAIHKWLEKKYDYQKHGYPSWKMLVNAIINLDIGIASAIANGHKAIEAIVDKLDSDFRGLTREMCNEILENGTTIDQLRLTIVIYLNDKDMILSSTEQNNLADILTNLIRDKQYYNFLNHSLLDILVTNFGSEKLKTDMEQYKLELKRFRQKTVLCDFVEYFEAQIIFSVVDLKDFLIKIKGDWNKFTLEDMEIVKRNITQKFFLPSFAMILKSIKPGCIEITWLIYDAFVDSLIIIAINENLIEFCTLNRLTCIRIGEKCIYCVVKGYSAFLKNIYSEIKEVQGLIPPQLIQIEKESGSILKIPIKEHEIGFSIRDRCHQPRLILIEGAAESGKSVFSKYCCHKWSQGELFGNVDLLLLLSLSDSKVASAKKIEDLLYHPEAMFQQFLADEIKDHTGKGMALWLDGWDNLSKDKRSCSIFTNLLHGDLLPQAKVIVTCRPWAANELKKMSGCSVDQHIQISSERGEQDSYGYRQSRPREDYISSQRQGYAEIETGYYFRIERRYAREFAQIEREFAPMERDDRRHEINIFERDYRHEMDIFKRDYPIRRCRQVFCYIIILLLTLFAAIASLALGIYFILVQNSSVSKIELGNSDFVLLSHSASTESTETTISTVTDNTTIQIFYLNQCSVDTQQLNFTITLDMLTANEFHRIDEPYLVSGSQLQYTFSTPVTNVSSHCAALVYVFHNSTSYTKFVTNGIVINANTTCLPSNSSINITISTKNGNQYYFIGLISYIPEITINYTVTGNLLSYNVTGLSPIITCSLTTSSPECSVPLQDLPPGEDACIVGTLQLGTNNFTTIVVNTSFNSRSSSIGFSSFYMATSGLLFIVLLLITFIVIIRRLRR